jgi:ribosomal protein S27AE
MARRTPRFATTHEQILIPLKEHCEQCGQPLWVANHGHRTVTTLSGLWKLTLVVRKSYPAGLSTLPSALPTRGGRALGVAAW